MQLPDKLMKMINIHDDGIPGDKMMQKHVDVEIVGGDKAGKEFTVTSDGNGDGAGKAVKQIIIKSRTARQRNSQVPMPTKLSSATATCRAK